VLELVSRAVSAQSEGFRLQLEASELARKGALGPAADKFASFVVKQREALELNRELNATVWPTPSPLEPLAQVLVDGLFMYADVKQQLGDEATAVSLRDEAIAVAEAELSPVGQAEARRSSALALLSDGRFNESLDNLFVARDVFVKLERHLKAARISVDLADAFAWLGDYSRALGLLDDANSRIDSISVPDGVDGLMDRLEIERVRKELPYYRGMIYRYLGQYDLAETLLREAIAGYGFDRGAKTGVEYQYLMVLAKLGKTEDFLRLLASLEALFAGDGRLQPKIPALLRAKAEALANAGDVDAALDSVVEALKIGERISDPEVRWSVHFQHGEILLRLNREPEAVEAYAKAIEILGNLRCSPLGYRLDSAYVASRKEVYTKAIGVAATTQRSAQCATFMEEIKARGLTAALRSPVSRPAESTPHVKRLSTELTEIARQLDAIEYRALDKEWTPELNKTRQQLLDRRRGLLEQLHVSDPRWKSLTTTTQLDVASLLDVLEKRHQAAISMFLDGDKLSVVLLGNGRSSVRQFHLEPHLTSRLNIYFGNLSRRKPEPRLFDPSQSLNISADELVPRDFWTAAFENESVVVVPHGRLHLLPWASLTLDGKRLFSFRPVGVLPNLSCLTALSFEPATEPSAVVLGPPDYGNLAGLRPLDEGAKEVELIADIYEKKGRLRMPVVTGPAATESAMLQILHEPQHRAEIAHICCHATIELEEPMSSGLLLSDGKVDAAEIAASKIQFEEVVLSACSTGWRPAAVGDIELAADDCLGIPGAFLEAGARAVLVSIPPADDEVAKDFMIAYHQKRGAGAPPLSAYCAVQREMLESEEHSPELWAGLTMYGCV